MEYQVSPAEDRHVTKDLLNRFLRMAEAHHSQVRLIDVDANGTGFTGARLEMNPKDVMTNWVIRLAGVDGFELVPIPEVENT
ncbi:MAG TPA: hypothetical protein VFK97_00365 [Candidatus Saccharimonadales bacterium]|nr:hypothetical protein [Candidatus Saccharimonadales bacterium]